MALRLQLLGTFALRDEAGRPLALPTRKAEALLALLARHPGTPRPRAWLAGLLWPDRGSEQARGSLRQALAALRRTLAAHAVEGPVAAGDAVVLGGAGLAVDLARLEQALDAGRGAEALALYRRPLLQDFPPGAEAPLSGWVEAERAALAARVREAALSLLEGQVARGEAEAGLALAERLLALEPTLEAAWRARMHLLAARGERAQALGEYARCRAALEQALGVAPSPRTQALALALREPAPEPRLHAPGAAPTLAVAAFEPLGSPPGGEPLARGLAEDIRTELARFRSLALLAPGTGGADYALQGSVRQGSGRMRLYVQLVEQATGRQVWADRFEADLADVFSVQDRVTAQVVSALAQQLETRQLASAQRRPVELLDAYELCLRGMARVREGTLEADEEARALFQRALSLEPDSARAWAGLSLSHFNEWSCLAWGRWEDTQRRAYDCAERAARLDGSDPVTQLILARILLYRREFERAEAHLERALALNPHDADLLAHASLGMAYLGRGPESLALGQQARALRVGHPDWYLASLATGHLVQREPREVAALLERAPDSYTDTRAFLAAAHAHLGEAARAAACREAFLTHFTRNITGGRLPAEGEPRAWVLRVNPLRRGEDRAFLEEGLQRAGL